MSDNIFKVDNDKNDKFIEFLSNLSNSRIPWIQRKEVSAWSAILFLYAILWSITSYIKSTDIITDSIVNIIVLLFQYAIIYIFFRFIHAQYASIYNMLANTNVINKIIFNFCEKDNSFFKTNKISNYESFQKQIDNDVKSELQKEIQKFRGKCHPVQIVLYLWVPFIYRKGKGNKNKIVLGTHEKAEASIYSLIIISFLYSTGIFILNILACLKLIILYKP